MTGKEAAKINESSPGGRDQILDFLTTAPARELQQYIHNISVDPMSHLYQRARTALDIRLSEDAETTALRLERHTKHLLLLTYILAALTVGLLLFAYVQMKHDDHPNQHAQNYYEYHHDAA